MRDIKTKTNSLWLVLLSMLIMSCSSEAAKPVFVTSSNPVYDIVSEIVGIKANVKRVLPPGASPHTYEAKPSDLVMIKNAKALIYVSDMLDSWAVDTESDNKVELIALLPEESKQRFSDMTGNENDTVIDPHFWTDPIAVKAIVPALADSLAKYDKENADFYKKNAERFIKKLETLDRQVSAILQPVQGESLILFHPSMLYFMNRYGLHFAGAIEPSPGKEPSAKDLALLKEMIDKGGVKALFSEPQLPKTPAKTLSEASGIPVFILDPIGGIADRRRYSDMILYNAKTIKRAVSKL